LLNDIDPNLLVPFNNMSLSLIFGFFIGWSSAALGFGLSQPQVMIRFFAGKSPEETQKARLTYIGFLQFTWIGMTIFGVVARAILVEVEDPEAALFFYVSKNFSPLYVSIILIGVFSAIASTIDSLILACSNILSVDLLPIITKKEFINKKYIHQISTLAIVLLTLVLALFVQSSVFTLSAFAVSFLAATIGVAIMLKITRPSISFKSINVVLLTSGITAISWRLLGYHNDINEAFPSLILGLFIGVFADKYLFNKFKKPHNKQINRTP
jgi:sodium/proline symporter